MPEVLIPGLMFRFDIDSRPQTLLPCDFKKPRFFPEFSNYWHSPFPTWEASEIVCLKAIVLSYNSNATQPRLLAPGVDFSCSCGCGGNLGQSLQTTHIGLLPREMVPLHYLVEHKDPNKDCSPNITNIRAKPLVHLPEMIQPEKFSFKFCSGALGDYCTSADFGQSTWAVPWKSASWDIYPSLRHMIFPKGNERMRGACIIQRETYTDPHVIRF